MSASDNLETKINDLTELLNNFFRSLQQGSEKTEAFNELEKQFEVIGRQAVKSGKNIKDLKQAMVLVQTAMKNSSTSAKALKDQLKNTQFEVKDLDSEFGHLFKSGGSLEDILKNLEARLGETSDEVSGLSDATKKASADIDKLRDKFLKIDQTLDASSSSINRLAKEASDGSGKLMLLGGAAIFFSKQAFGMANNLKGLIQEVNNYNLAITNASQISPMNNNAPQDLNDLRVAIGSTRKEFESFVPKMIEASQVGIDSAQISMAATRIVDLYGKGSASQKALTDYIDLVKSFPQLEDKFTIGATVTDEVEGLYALASSGKLDVAIKAGVFGGEGESASDVASKLAEAQLSQEDITAAMSNSLTSWFPDALNLLPPLMGMEKLLGYLVTAGTGIAATVYSARQIFLGLKTVEEGSSQTLSSIDANTRSIASQGGKRPKTPEQIKQQGERIKQRREGRARAGRGGRGGGRGGRGGRGRVGGGGRGGLRGGRSGAGTSLKGAGIFLALQMLPSVIDGISGAFDDAANNMANLSDRVSASTQAVDVWADTFKNSSAVQNRAIDTMNGVLSEFKMDTSGVWDSIKEEGVSQLSSVGALIGTELLTGAGSTLIGGANSMLTTLSTSIVAAGPALLGAGVSALTSIGAVALNEYGKSMTEAGDIQYNTAVNDAERVEGASKKATGGMTQFAGGLLGAGGAVAGSLIALTGPIGLAGAAVAGTVAGLSMFGGMLNEGASNFYDGLNKYSDELLAEGNITGGLMRKRAAEFGSAINDMSFGIVDTIPVLGGLAKGVKALIGAQASYVGMIYGSIESLWANKEALKAEAEARIKQKQIYNGLIQEAQKLYGTQMDGREALQRYVNDLEDIRKISKSVEESKRKNAIAVNKAFKSLEAKVNELNVALDKAIIEISKETYDLASQFGATNKVYINSVSRRMDFERKAYTKNMKAITSVVESVLSDSDILGTGMQTIIVDVQKRLVSAEKDLYKGYSESIAKFDQLPSRTINALERGIISRSKDFVEKIGSGFSRENLGATLTASMETIFSDLETIPQEVKGRFETAMETIVTNQERRADLIESLGGSAEKVSESAIKAISKSISNSGEELSDDIVAAFREGNLSRAIELGREKGQEDKVKQIIDESKEGATKNLTELYKVIAATRVQNEANVETLKYKAEASINKAKKDIKAIEKKEKELIKEREGKTDAEDLIKVDEELKQLREKKEEANKAIIRAKTEMDQFSKNNKENMELLRKYAEENYSEYGELFKDGVIDPTILKKITADIERKIKSEEATLGDLNIGSLIAELGDSAIEVKRLLTENVSAVLNKAFKDIESGFELLYKALQERSRETVSAIRSYDLQRAFNSINSSMGITLEEAQREANLGREAIQGEIDDLNESFQKSQDTIVNFSDKIRKTIGKDTSEGEIKKLLEKEIEKSTLPAEYQKKLLKELKNLSGEDIQNLIKSGDKELFATSLEGIAKEYQMSLAELSKRMMELTKTFDPSSNLDIIRIGIQESALGMERASISWRGGAEQIIASEIELANKRRNITKALLDEQIKTTEKNMEDYKKEIQNSQKLIKKLRDKEGKSGEKLSEDEKKRLDEAIKESENATSRLQASILERRKYETEKFKLDLEYNSKRIEAIKELIDRQSRIFASQKSQAESLINIYEQIGAPISMILQAQKSSVDATFKELQLEYARLSLIQDEVEYAEKKAQISQLEAELASKSLSAQRSAMEKIIGAASGQLSGALGGFERRSEALVYGRTRAKTKAGIFAEVTSEDVKTLEQRQAEFQTSATGLGIAGQRMEKKKPEEQLVDGQKVQIDLQRKGVSLQEMGNSLLQRATSAIESLASSSGIGLNKGEQGKGWGPLASLFRLPMMARGTKPSSDEVKSAMRKAVIVGDGGEPELYISSDGSIIKTVGKNGEEVFVPPKPGEIIPYHDLSKFLPKFMTDSIPRFAEGGSTPGIKRASKYKKEIDTQIKLYKQLIEEVRQNRVSSGYSLIDVKKMEKVLEKLRTNPQTIKQEDLTLSKTTGGTGYDEDNIVSSVSYLTKSLKDLREKLKVLAEIETKAYTARDEEKKLYEKLIKKTEEEIRALTDKQKAEQEYIALAIKERTHLSKLIGSSRSIQNQTNNATVKKEEERRIGIATGTIKKLDDNIRLITEGRIEELRPAYENLPSEKEKIEVIEKTTEKSTKKTKERDYFQDVTLSVGLVEAEFQQKRQKMLEEYAKKDLEREEKHAKALKESDERMLDIDIRSAYERNATKETKERYAQDLDAQGKPRDVINTQLEALFAQRFAQRETQVQNYQEAERIVASADKRWVEVGDLIENAIKKAGKGKTGEEKTKAEAKAEKSLRKMLGDEAFEKGAIGGKQALQLIATNESFRKAVYEGGGERSKLGGIALRLQELGYDFTNQERMKNYRQAGENPQKIAEQVFKDLAKLTGNTVESIKGRLPDYSVRAFTESKSAQNLKDFEVPQPRRDAEGNIRRGFFEYGGKVKRPSQEARESAAKTSAPSAAPQSQSAETSAPSTAPQSSTETVPETRKVETTTEKETVASSDNFKLDIILKRADANGNITGMEQKVANMVRGESYQIAFVE